MTTQAVPFIPLDEWQAFSELLAGDAQFPDSYVECVDLTIEQIERATESGQTIREIIVHAQAFVDWCSAHCLEPTFALLEDFVVAQTKNDS